ncbi:unnamed protein product [Effrenium voratum]|uniref:Transmembrane protein n=1 Tax=Effrenium voratum TaxID=2562239 RepID=A0AA36HTY7_9DINO|nr:unnamed protein product [Effrenium voratum]CAJ1417668.1 unnamed protein product [Effrenium voratum]
MLLRPASPSLEGDRAEGFEAQGAEEVQSDGLEERRKKRIVEFMSSKQVLPEIMRSIRPHQAFASCGAALRLTEECRGHACEVTESIQDFWSHAWLGNSWGKFLTLLVLYNGRAALCLANGAALLGLALFLRGALPGYSRGLEFTDFEGARIAFSVWSLPFGAAGAAVGLVAWRAPRRVFFDRLCVDEADRRLQFEAIVSLPGILQRSDSLLVLWDPIWPSRLWCIFELAAFLSLNKGPPRVFPTMMGPCSLGAFFLGVCAMAPLTLVPVAGFNYILVAACTIGAAAASACPAVSVLRAYYRAVEDMEKKLRTLRIIDTSCACCSRGHMKADGTPMLCDKVTICACITQWFGSIEAFEEYVQTDVTDVLVHQLQWCTFRYAWSCALGMPAFWACLDVASIPYQHGDVNHVVAWLSYGLTCALLVFPCLGSWSKFFTHLFRHRGRSWLHEAMQTFLVILCTLPFAAYAVGAMMLPLTQMRLASPPAQWLAFPCLMLPLLLLQCCVPKRPDLRLRAGSQPASQAPKEEVAV